ncbi:MAG: phosphoribosylformylglycinamidine synthase subunit PurL [Actinomycetota bacterium]
MSATTSPTGPPSAGARADLHRKLGLTDDELAKIEQILGRSPNHAELAMYSVMWSEHCSYKSSRRYLKSLPSGGDHVLVGPGEGAGVIRVDDVALALRLESHNHPSFVEPVQGAATGIGGVVRDVLSMGARPIALLDSLRFGPLQESAEVSGSEPGDRDRGTDLNRFLVDGVVSGISSYGNCIGVPTVGGEIKFEDPYAGNPLVNVMCLGVAPLDGLKLARAEGLGNQVLLLGSSTGRDGIGGVSVLASATFDENAAEKRPSVQVGDPFTEKLLIEACLSLIQKGLVVGIQDLGGAGLCCATSESAANAGTGMRIHLERVPRRNAGMAPFEVLTSESQERMLVIVRPADARAALAECERMGLLAACIGEVIEGGAFEVMEGDQVAASVPASSLGDGPNYDRPVRKPGWIDALNNHDVTIEPPPDLGEALAKLVGSPNLASKKWAWEQYDHQVMLGTVVGPGHDAAVLRIPGAKTRVAVTVDGNGRYCYLDPFAGTQHSVAEAARNISSLGARPAAITNCLNFGDPEQPEVMWQFTEAVRGLGEACLALETPVTGGNVSFYNQTGSTSIYPTPVVGMVGLLPQGVSPPPIGFAHEGDVIVLLGSTKAEFGGSEYLARILGRVEGRLPVLDLELEAAVGTVVRAAVAEGLLSSSHDCSSGGLGVALAKCCAMGGVGAKVQPERDMPAHHWLFSESASRVLVSLPDGTAERLAELAGEHSVPLARLGKVGGDGLIVAGELVASVAALAEAFDKGFAGIMTPGQRHVSDGLQMGDNGITR